MTRQTDGIPEYANAERYVSFSTGTVDFVERHGLWSAAQQEAARTVDKALPGIDLVRVVYGDPHGLVRSKTLTVPAFRGALRNGMDASPGPFVFDTGHAVAVDFFADGGGIGVPELTGAGDFILVPDPTTFRVLPGPDATVGWIIGDEYLRIGQPHPLSSRFALRRQLDRLSARGLDLVVGLEIEWTLTRMLNEGRPVAVGGFGVQGSPPEVEVVNGGYQFNLDLFTDKLMPVLAPLARRLESVGLPLRTVEHESGPGQIELTFSPMSGLAAADAVLLIRVLTKQVCDRLGYHASFMALPGIPGLDPNGWHLHQSLYDVSRGRNVFAADDGESALSETGRHYLAGLLAHAADISMLCVPTVNGYRRLADDYSLSPDRVVWSVENRGSFLRVCGSPGEPSTHLENRVGEPCANPYLAIAAQLAAGLDGVDSTLDPGAMATAPHDPRSRRLPRSLADALTALETGRIGREVLGEPLWRALVRLKRSEWDRFRAWAASNGVDLAGGKASEWEHREYFDVF